MYVKDEFSDKIVFLCSLHRTFSKFLVITLSSDNTQYFILSFKYNGYLSTTPKKQDNTNIQILF